MNLDLLLSIVAALAGFAVKTTLAFGLCLACSWLAGSPSRRFVVWLVFLAGTAAYWLWLANSFFAVSLLPAAGPHASSQGSSSAAGVLQIPSAWAPELGVALRVIGLTYLVVLSCMLFAHIKRQRQLHWVLGFTTKPPAAIADMFQPLAKSLHVGHSRLLLLSGVASPATFGWIRPTILLPSVCLEQDSADLEDILRHELHHVRRWDFVWNGGAIVCRALLCFHPAAWYAVRQIQFDRELACDLAVVADSPTRRAHYAECLIHFARLNSLQNPQAWGIDFAASSEHLKTRVHSILGASKKSSAWSRCLRMACGMSLLVGFVSAIPSLEILLAYAHVRVSQPVTSAIRPTSGIVLSKIRVPKKSRLSTSSATVHADAAATGSNEVGAAQPDATFSANRQPESTASAKNSLGPKLVHRNSPSLIKPPATAGNSSKQQSVDLTDDPGQASKSGDHDRKQALQQSATAAVGIYRRLGAVDRH